MGAGGGNVLTGQQPGGSVAGNAGLGEQILRPALPSLLAAPVLCRRLASCPCSCWPGPALGTRGHAPLHPAPHPILDGGGATAALAPPSGGPPFCWPRSPPTALAPPSPSARPVPRRLLQPVRQPVVPRRLEQRRGKPRRCPGQRFQLRAWRRQRHRPHCQRARPQQQPADSQHQHWLRPSGWQQRPSCFLTLGEATRRAGVGGVGEAPGSAARPAHAPWSSHAGHKRTIFKGSAPSSSCPLLLLGAKSSPLCKGSVQ